MRILANKSAEWEEDETEKNKGNVNEGRVCKSCKRRLWVGGKNVSNKW